MLPDSDDAPSELGKHPIGIQITLAVGRDLLTPPRSVGLRHSPVLWATVPEATIDEHRHSCTDEHEVGATTAQSLQRGPIDSIPQSPAPQLASECQFRRSVASPLVLHPLSNYR